MAVAEELHSARAATRLRTVPAAASQRIRDLECELGVRPFERTNRRVVLTPAGQRLLGPSRTVLANPSSARFLAEVVTALPGLEVAPSTPSS